MTRNTLVVGLALSMGLCALAGQDIGAPAFAAQGKAVAPADISLSMGVRNYQKGFIAKAIPYFERAAVQNPNSAEAFVWLARSYQKQGNPADLERAKLAWRKVLNINPNNVEALSSLGELWSWEPACREDAINLLKHAYDLNPADAVVARRLSDALLWQGQAEEALRYAAPIASRYRTDAKFMAGYAQMLSAAGRTDQALGIYSDVLKQDSGNFPLRLEQARALAKSGRMEKAREAYNAIVTGVSGTKILQDSNFRLNIGGLAFDLGLYADAIQWDNGLPDAMQRQKDIQLRTARALTKTFRVPEAVDRFNRLYEAGLLTSAEKLEFAEYLRMLNLEGDSLPSPNLVENLYREALQADPAGGEAALRLARLYTEQEGRYNEAVTAYQQALAIPELKNRDGVKKEFLDFIKSDKSQAATAERLFKQMLAEAPDDVAVQTAYAEFLSWQSDRRPEALQAYIALAKADPDNRDIWEKRLEEVLKWHQPTTDLIPTYQEVVNLYPQNRRIWWTVAKAYAGNKDYYPEAVETYSKLVKRFPDDGTIKREWLALLLSNESKRGENIRLLSKMVQDDPGDLDVLATYGKLLSYEHRLGDAMNAFDKVLSQDPAHRDALVGKGYVFLWSGRKLHAKEYFEDLRQKYPDDVDIAIGLAQSDKLLGRYDEALKIINEIKPLLQQASPEASSVGQSGTALELAPGFLPVADFSDPRTPLQRHAVYDAMVEPAPAPALRVASQPKDAHPGISVPEADLKSLQSEVQALDDAVKALEALQQSSRSQLDHIEEALHSARDAHAGETSLQTPEDYGYLPSGRMAGSGGSFAGSGSLSAFSSGSGAYAGSHKAQGNVTVGEGGMQPVLGTYAALDYDTNPLLSGLGRFRNDELTDLEKGLTNDLRPMIRGGFLYSMQDGERTTTALNSWGFPNQVSLSLTPQIRLRGGITPTRWFIPNGVSPDSTVGLQYGLGGTVKYWDHLTLDGDFAITYFTQSHTSNFTFQTQAQYDFNDSISMKLGSRRLPQTVSLLSVAGLKPSQGAFRNRDLVGQARENSLYAELNLHPFSQNIDWNLGYEWGFVEGEGIPNNTKNQAFTSLGYTWHMGPKHQLRAGYEFLYFGYGKNATAGFFDTTSAGLRVPVGSLDPVAAAPGYVFGGYFSPRWFVMNAGRMDIRGSLFNKLLEYKLGGSLGYQSFGLGHGISKTGVDTGSLTSAFDANIIMNLTDWLAAYGDIDYLDAGGQFNRWRFGGGLIVRPHIDALSPVFGQPGGRPLSSNPQ